MCLFPRLILNKKYVSNKSNGGCPPPLLDERLKFVPVPCGMCVECRKRLSREWSIRLNWELKRFAGYFVTLTFSPESLQNLCFKYNVVESNAIATLSVKLFRDRFRKKYKKSIRHWLITELGHTNSERIHLHGILFTNDIVIDNDILFDVWQYGNVYVGDYCNDMTINYVVKYVTKVDLQHKNFRSIVLCSPGIGSNFLDSPSAITNRFNFYDTYEFYTFPNFKKSNMPSYFRNKMYDDEQREFLWLNLLEKHTRFVLGRKVDISGDGIFLFEKLVQDAQRKNKRIGYGDDSDEWKKQDYNITNRMLNKLKNKQ